MNVILGYAQMIEKATSEETVRERARIIREQVSRISEIIETLLHMPSGDCEHEVVSCLDVLEHLAEVDIIAAITELWRITHSTLIIAVSCVSEPSRCSWR